MIADAIKFILSNFSLILFAASFVAAAVSTKPAYFPERLLNWLLLLSVGLQSIWAGLFHIFFPHTAASSIGWQVSPFQFEIGVADTAIGIVAVLSFWRSLDFKGAVVGYITLFFIGVAIGHVREAMAGNFSPNNFGLLLVITIVQIVLLPALYGLVRRRAG